MKKVAIMQPYFFPYVGYIGLIKHTDEFILFDPVQYMRHGWIERNRVLKQDEGWLYIKVPLMPHSQNTLIKDILIDNTQDWGKKLIAQLQPYKKIAPYYHEVEQLVINVLNGQYADIVSLNKVALEAVCDYLGIEHRLQVFSQMNLAIEEPHAPDEWALNICKALRDVEEYWNPPGGQAFFNKIKYDDAHIALKFMTPQLTPYDQKRQPFEPGLSILDVMMFNDPEQINDMLDAYELT
jgi:hypothetical protein